MQPYPRSPDLVWPGHLHGTGCLSARAVGTGFPTVVRHLCLGPVRGWVWVLLTPPVLAGVLGGRVWARFVVLSLLCRLSVVFVVGVRFRPAFGSCVVAWAPRLPPRRFRFWRAVWACVLGPGLGCAQPFLAGLSGCAFCAFSFLGVPIPGLVVPVPPSPFFRAGLLALFFFFFFSLCATPRHSWLGFAAGGGGRSPPLLAGVRWRWWCVVCGVWCVAVMCWWGCGWCVVWLVPRHSWRRFLCASPRHSWLSFAAGGCGRSPPLLAGVRWRRWCVVCGGGVLVGLWLVCGVVGPSPLLAEVPVCYSPPLLAGFRCRWWWAVPATAGWGLLAVVVCGVWCVVCGGDVLVGLWLVCGVVGPSPLLAEVPVCFAPPLLAEFRCRWLWAVPATPGWGPLAAVVCGVWRWCVGGVVAGVWCGWSLATPGGGSCVLLPATPGGGSCVLRPATPG